MKTLSRCQTGVSVLLFTRVKGADFPLVTNLFGTPRRAAMAFGSRPGRFIRRLVAIAESILPPTPSKLWGVRDVALDAMKIGLSSSARGPVTEVVTADVRLDRLPVITSWAGDGGRRMPRLEPGVEADGPTRSRQPRASRLRAVRGLPW